MKKDKLTYKSNANIRNFSIDDIGKLSINDIKKLKDMFGPKQRKSTKKREEMIYQIMIYQIILLGLVQTIWLEVLEVCRVRSLEVHYLTQIIY